MGFGDVTKNSKKKLMKKEFDIMEVSNIRVKRDVLWKARQRECVQDSDSERDKEEKTLSNNVLPALTSKEAV